MLTRLTGTLTSELESGESICNYAIDAKLQSKGTLFIHNYFQGLFKSEFLSQWILRLVILCYVFCFVVVEFQIVIPALYGGRIPLVYKLLAIYFLVGLVSSCILLVRTDPSIRRVVLVNNVADDWIYCVVCQTVKPPRTRHCYRCDVCILRSDHHCVILGQCVGFANWRFFYSLLFHSALAAAFATWFNVHYVFLTDLFLTSTDAQLGFRFLCTISPPGVFWLLGLINLWETCVFMLTSSGFLFACLLSCFFCYYTTLMLRNQTMSHRRQLPPPHPQGHSTISSFMINVRQYLGRNWLLAVLLPFYPSPLITDGLSMM